MSEGVMGLSVSHDCWAGPYSMFGEWRSALFDAAFGGGPRAKYDYLHKDVWHSVDMRDDDPLVGLLMHSDSEGDISPDEALPLAARLASLLPRLRQPYREWTEQFIAGLGRAHALGEVVEFR